VLDDACELLAHMTVRYGSAQKACERFCDPPSGSMRFQGLAALAKDLAEVAIRL
jgi:hypothetical protein